MSVGDGTSVYVGSANGVSVGVGPGEFFADGTMVVGTIVSVGSAGVAVARTGRAPRGTTVMRSTCAAAVGTDVSVSDWASRWSVIRLVDFALIIKPTTASTKRAAPPTNTRPLRKLIKYDL